MTVRLSIQRYRRAKPRWLNDRKSLLRRSIVRSGAIASDDAALSRPPSRRRALSSLGRVVGLPEGRLGVPLRRHPGLRQPAACAAGEAHGGASASRAVTCAGRRALSFVQVRGRGAGAWRSAVYGSGRAGARGAGRGGAGVRGGRDPGQRGSAGGEGGGAVVECDCREGVADIGGSPDVRTTS